MKTLEAPRTEPLSAYLDPESLRFHRSRGGLLALTLTSPEGEETTYDRVIVLRAFPLTSPEEYLSVREPIEGKREIGMLRSLAALDEESERLVRDELATRYFVPHITRIHSLHRRRGVIYLDAETESGRRRVTLRDGLNSVRILDCGRVLLTDVDGNTLEIPDPRALDKASYRKIEVFL